MSETIINAIINASAVIIIGLLSIYNTNKSKDIENEKEAMITYIKLSGGAASKSIINTINEIENGQYDFHYEHTRILMSVNRDVRNKIKAMCINYIKNKSVNN